MFFKLPKNQSIRKTIFNVVAVYLITTISLVVVVSLFYVYNFKQTLLTQTNTQANYLINQLESLHDSIVEGIAIYPRSDEFESGIFDIDKNLIFSTFKNKDILFDKKVFYKDDYVYFVYKIEPYYLGSAYLVIQKKKDNKAFLVFLVASLIVVFLILSSFVIAKIIIKPLSNNVIKLDRFIKDTTHELNTPISVILNNIEMLDQDTIGEKNLKKINRIKVATLTILNIYDDLSFLLLKNKQKSNNKNLNISNILLERIEFFEALANNKRIKLKLDIDKDVFLYIDKTKFQRVIDNLLSNAIKYSFVNKTIKITLKNKMFCVEDEGVGMDENEIKNVFVRYKRFNSSSGGFGIGYNVIYSIINEYNIKIDIKSKKQKGTKVTLTWD